MLTAQPLGATTGFTCSIGGVCVGQTVATQQLFLALQREANRVAGVLAITGRIANDGKIGAQTVGLLRQIADRAAMRGPIDQALDDVRIEQSPAQDARDVAASAEALVAALQRQGAPATGAAVASISDFVQNIIRAGQTAPTLPVPPKIPALPIPPSNVLPVPIDPYPATPPGSLVPAGSASPPLFSSTWASWKIPVAIGVGFVALGTILAIFLRPR